jgi:predicted branched-subunit amino acid permease
MGFALTTLLVVLAIEAFRAAPDLRTASLAVVCAVTAQGLFPQQMLRAALSLFALHTHQHHPRLTPRPAAELDR